MNSQSNSSPGEAGSAMQEVPAGGQKIPGYILDVCDGSAWITPDGQVTDQWQERGIWPTPEAAADMMQRCLSRAHKVSELASAMPVSWKSSK